MIDTERALRLILARLEEDHHAASLLMEQIGECDACIGGLISYLLAFCSDIMYELESSQDDLAIDRVEQQLADVLEDMRTHR